MFTKTTNLLLFVWLSAGSASAIAQTTSARSDRGRDASGKLAGETVQMKPQPTQPQHAGTHDMLLLLPSGPMHLRVEVTDGGKSLKAKREDYMAYLIAELDVDKDGHLSSTETSKHPLFVTGRRFEGNKFLQSLKSRKPFSDRELNLAVERAAGQLISFRQNNSLAEQDLSVFRVLDEDESGLIERDEMRTSAARIATRDLDFDQCITFDEFLEQTQVDPLSVVVANSGEPPGSVHSEILRDANEPTVAQRLVRRYDKDRDARLSAEELTWASERTSVMDADGDQLLNVQELSAISGAEPDLSLAIDLSATVDQAMKVRGGRLNQQCERVRGDLVKIKQAAFALSIGYQARDLAAESQRNARAAFNAIDADANGYLDRDEIVDHQRFERYLFDAMDADSDDRVFAEEMLTYVSAYTQPATTSCQATLFDASSGFFQVLDENADGRISIRELRQSEELLLAHGGQGQEINPSRMTRAYRIEFQRGGVSLFGRVDRPQAETPEALLRAPIGPVWFQRMDRNSDGDLVWDEFLGPREAFHKLDSDGDNLIDAQEAGAYETNQKP